MDAFELSLCLGIAIAVDLDVVIALEFFDGGFEGGRVRTVELASKIAEIVEASDLAGDLIHRVEVADFEGKDFVCKGSLVTADNESPLCSVERDFLRELAISIGGDLEDLAIDKQGALGGGDGPFVDVFEDEAQRQSVFVNGESVSLLHGAGFGFQ
jgi:hypothetical protein